MPQSFACLHVHIVFSTKNRAPLITPPLAKRLYSFIGGIVRKRKCQLVRAGGTADHVHFLINLARDISVADLVRDIKANSTGWVHEHFPEHQAFAWQQGYSVFSVSRSGMPAVCKYIDNQEAHHRRRDFKQELRLLLDKHEIEYDERYMWD